MNDEINECLLDLDRALDTLVRRLKPVTGRYAEEGTIRLHIQARIHGFFAELEYTLQELARLEERSMSTTYRYV